MRLVLATLLALPLTGGLARASDIAGPGDPAGTDIPVQEWQAMTTGRTVTYAINGDLWALEHYFPGTNRVEIQLYDGTCMEGTWDYQAPYYCFHWEGRGTSCFRHTRSNGTIQIIEAQDGSDTAMTQEFRGVSDTPLECGIPSTS